MADYGRRPAPRPSLAHRDLAHRWVGTKAGGAIVDSGVATIAGTGSVTANALLLVQAAASLAASGSLTIAALLLVQAAAALSATGTLSTTALLLIQAAATVPSAGAVSSTALVEVQGAATVPSAGAVSSTALVEVQGAATIPVQGDVVPDPLVLVQGDSSVFATGTITATGEAVRPPIIPDRGGPGPQYRRWVEGKASIKGNLALLARGLLLVQGGGEAKVGHLLPKPATVRAGELALVGGNGAVYARGESLWPYEEEDEELLGLT